METIKIHKCFYEATLHLDDETFRILINQLFIYNFFKEKPNFESFSEDKNNNLKIIWILYKEMFENENNLTNQSRVNTVMESLKARKQALLKDEDGQDLPF